MHPVNFFFFFFFTSRSRFSWVSESLGAIHSTKLTGNFGPKLNGSVRSNRKSFEKTGPPFEVVLFSRSDRLEFWLNGSRPFSQDIGRILTWKVFFFHENLFTSENSDRFS